MFLIGLDNDRMNCGKVFNLFCQYGNIQKINFIKTGRAEGSCMMEMSDPDAADRVVRNMKNIGLFGKPLRLDYSKAEYIDHIRNPHTLQDGTLGYLDVEHDRNYGRNNRFDTPERAAKNRIVPPSKTLHFYNVPKMEDDRLLALFTENGAAEPVKVKWLPHKSDRSASGLVDFETVDEAGEALALVNHLKIDGEDSKRPYDMKLCFSPALGDRDQRRY